MVTIELLFDLIDAIGGGVCRLEIDGSIAQYSPGFASIAQAPVIQGKYLAEIFPGMPPLENIVSTQSAANQVDFRHIGKDGVAREISVSCFLRDDRFWLAFVDRSTEAKLTRQGEKLGRMVTDLQDTLSNIEQTRMLPQVRTLSEISMRLAEHLERAERYVYPVSLAWIACANYQEGELARLILRSTRAVDDLGITGQGAYILVLPHTDLRGAEIVGKRIVEKMNSAKFRASCVGVAQSQGSEKPSDIVARAERASKQAVEEGGGVLLAVDVV